MGIAMTVPEAIHFALITTAAIAAAAIAGDPSLILLAVCVQAGLVIGAYGASCLRGAEMIDVPLFGTAIFSALFAPAGSAQVLLLCLAIAEFCHMPICMSLGLWEDE